MRVAGARIAAALAACASLMLASVEAAHASEAPKSDVDEAVILNTWSDEARCARGMATAVTFADIAARSGALIGKCVALSGLWGGRVLYNGMEGYYLAGPRLGSPALTPDRAIGVYARESLMAALGHEGPRYATIVGILGTCAALSDGAIMVMGYCHYAWGPYIAASATELAPGRVTRQVSETARTRWGDLQVLPDSDPERAELESVAMHWLRALRSADVEDFARLQDIPMSEVDMSDENGVFYAAFVASDSSFAALRARKTTPPIILFRQKREQAADDDDASTAESHFVACVCAAKDCTGRWPIAGFDAANAPERPYVCTVVTHAPGDAQPWAVETSVDWSRMPEP